MPYGLLCHPPFWRSCFTKYILVSDHRYGYLANADKETSMATGYGTLYFATSNSSDNSNCVFCPHSTARLKPYPFERVFSQALTLFKLSGITDTSLGRVHRFTTVSMHFWDSCTHFDVRFDDRIRRSRANYCN